jgi:hypothetical protein
VSHNEVHQQVHFLPSDSQKTTNVVEVPNNSTITPRDFLPKEQESNPSDHHSINSFGPTTIATFGDLVYSRSGDKGANVNVGFFFPMGKDMKAKWEWLRSFLTRERFCG